MNDSIRIFAPGRGGNIEPIRTINQGISEPTSIAIDSKGLIYVANQHTGSGTETITVYPANADSITNPIRTITGANTHLHGVSSIALDSSDNLYVANPYDGTNGSITLYLAGANGNVYPAKRFHGNANYNTGIHKPSGVAVDANRNVHVVNEYTSNPSDWGVFTFTPFVPLTKPTAARNIKVSGSSTSSTQGQLELPRRQRRDADHEVQGRRQEGHRDPTASTSPPARTSSCAASSRTAPTRSTSTRTTRSAPRRLPVRRSP